MFDQFNFEFGPERIAHCVTIIYRQLSVILRGLSVNFDTGQEHFVVVLWNCVW